MGKILFLLSKCWIPSFLLFAFFFAESSILLVTFLLGLGGGGDWVLPVETIVKRGSFSVEFYSTADLNLMEKCASVDQVAAHFDDQGTIVVAGRARAVVVGVGANTAMGSIRDSMMHTEDVSTVNFCFCLYFSFILHLAVYKLTILYIAWLYLFDLRKLIMF